MKTAQITLLTATEKKFERNNFKKSFFGVHLQPSKKILHWTGNPAGIEGTKHM